MRQGKESIRAENNTSLEGAQTGTEGAQQQGRTFTQEDVNRIVQERLAKEKGKGNEDLDRRAAELDLRERKLNAVTKLREKGLPDYLADVLNMNTDDDLDKGIEAILKMKGESRSTDKEPVVIGRGNPIGTFTNDCNAKDDSKTRSAFGLK